MWCNKIPAAGCRKFKANSPEAATNGAKVTKRHLEVLVFDHRRSADHCYRLVNTSLVRVKRQRPILYVPIAVE